MSKSDLKICRICLRTEAKVYHFDQYQLKAYYEEVMASKVNNDDKLPHCFCYECANTLHKFHKFKEKCYRGYKALKEVLWRGPLSYESVYKIDRKIKNLESPLTKKTFESIFVNVNKTKDTGPIVIGKKHQAPKNIEIENSYKDNGIQTAGSVCEDMETEESNELNKSTELVFIKEETIKVENEHRTSDDTSELEGKNCNGYRKKHTRLLNTMKWKKINLTEEEALEEFRSKANDPKYVTAIYKCLDCFRTFSKSDMLKRHIRIRHNENRGAFDCRFCRMRFKWNSLLCLHMREHYTKYQCLVCPFVCSLKSSAVLHEEYHSGVTRKCEQCGEEFRHLSTYYTHVRCTHRSRHVCAACGASFVSAPGLRQHRRLKHADSPDECEDVDTHCKRCDITFETKKAYEEHLFHSILHTDVIEDQIQDKIVTPNKVLGKRLRAKITKSLSNGKPNEEKQHSNSCSDRKRRKKPRRIHKKPTTCHQCGKHFETQSACLKHHLAAHPRTSFFPPNERYVCDLCGASLAPGSIAAHQNMHTREKVFACDSCGRQFHSSVGLKRHQLTHTGEKPFACSLCDKRFTQSNSMKLHYRTYHLKQPYPKRNRRKKKTDPQEAVEVESSGSGGESDGSAAAPAPLPKPRLEPVAVPVSLPVPVPIVEPVPVAVPEPVLVPVANAMPEEHLPESTVHYLTLN